MRALHIVEKATTCIVRHFYGLRYFPIFRLSKLTNLLQKTKRQMFIKDPWWQFDINITFTRSMLQMYCGYRGTTRSCLLNVVVFISSITRSQRHRWGIRSHPRLMNNSIHLPLSQLGNGTGNQTRRYQPHCVETTKSLSYCLNG